MTEPSETTLTDTDLERILSHAAHVSAGQGGTNNGRKIIDIIADRFGRTKIEALTADIDRPTVPTPGKEPANATITIRAAPNTISLHPRKDGTWELTCHGQTGDTIHVLVSQDDGTLTELLAELEETA
jgi:hypothetical protein